MTKNFFASKSEHKKNFSTKLQKLKEKLKHLFSLLQKSDKLTSCTNSQLETFSWPQKNGQNFI